MTDEVKTAMRTVIEYLDEKMQEAPNRKLADASNLLEDLLAEEE